VLLVAETLKGFPALLQIALPLLFVEGVRRFLLCAEAKEDLPAAPPLRYLRVAEVKRRVRRIWGGRTHASLRAGCGSRSGSTPRHSNSPRPSGSRELVSLLSFMFVCAQHAQTH
jgi:hypothetical protein